MNAQGDGIAQLVECQSKKFRNTAGQAFLAYEKMTLKMKTLSNICFI
jgi:hypothetical protein